MESNLQGNYYTFLRREVAGRGLPFILSPSYEEVMKASESRDVFLNFFCAGCLAQGFVTWLWRSDGVRRSGRILQSLGLHQNDPFRQYTVTQQYYPEKGT